MNISKKLIKVDNSRYGVREGFVKPMEVRMFSGVNKKCSACKGECKQYKQITIIECPQYEPKKRTDTRNGYLDSIGKPPELAYKELEMAQGYEGAISKI